MIKDVQANCEKKMKSTLDAFRHELGTIRTGRATVSLLDGISVDYYGTPTPLNQVAKLAVPDPTLITVQPFDPSISEAIEKAIRKADLGLNPANDGKTIRVPIPPLTEERRKQLAKKAARCARFGVTPTKRSRSSRRITRFPRTTRRRVWKKSRSSQIAMSGWRMSSSRSRKKRFLSFKR